MRKVVLVDDHTLLRNGLSKIIQEFKGYTVLFEAENGLAFIAKLDPKNLPDIVLLDISMPEMNGYETAEWIKHHHPSIKVLVLSMFDDEKSVLRMLQFGVKGYMLKDTEPKELFYAFNMLYEKGMYFNNLVYNNLLGNIKNKLCDPFDEELILMSLRERDKEFLRLICTEKPLKQIANEMYLSPRTIDDYRDTLFEKLHVNSRVGLVLFAIRTKLVQL